MTQQPPEEGRVVFERGPEAAREVADDPFWSTVARRHPDVDVVVLPPEEPRRVEVPPGEPVIGRDQAAELCERTAGAWWSAVQPDAPADRTDHRWLAGEADGTVRHEATWSQEDVDPVAATAAIGRLADLLERAGWRSFSPPGGLPRVLGTRDGHLGRAEIQLVHVSTAARLVMRLRSELLHVGPEAAAEMVAGTTEGES